LLVHGLLLAHALQERFFEGRRLLGRGCVSQQTHHALIVVEGGAAVRAAL
jgi:hypothetical protein